MHFMSYFFCFEKDLHKDGKKIWHYFFNTPEIRGTWVLAIWSKLSCILSKVSETWTGWVAIFPIWWSERFSLAGAGGASVFPLLCKAKRRGWAEGNAMSRRWHRRQSCSDSCTCRVLGSRSHCYFCLVGTNHGVYFLRAGACSSAYLGGIPYWSLKRMLETQSSVMSCFVLPRSSRQCHRAHGWLGIGHLSSL